MSNEISPTGAGRGDDDELCVAGGFSMPEFLRRRDLAPIRPFGLNPIARDIAELMSLHPKIDAAYPSVDLRTMTPDELRVLLLEINETLGIRPLKTRTLPYVGPAEHNRA